MCKRSLVKSPYGIQINLHVIIFWFGHQYSEPLLWNKLGIRRLFKNKKKKQPILYFFWHSQGSSGLSVFVYSIYSNFVSEIILSGHALSKKSTLITDSKRAWFLLGKLVLLQILFLLLKWQWNKSPGQCQEGCHYAHKRAGLTRHLSWTDASAALSSKAGWQILLAQSWSTASTVGVKAAPSQALRLLKQWSRTERQTQCLSRFFSGNTQRNDLYKFGLLQHSELWALLNWL